MRAASWRTWKHQLDSPHKISRHPVGAREKDVGLFAGSRRTHKSLPEEAVDDARYPYVLGNSGQPGPQAATPTHLE